MIYNVNQMGNIFFREAFKTIYSEKYFRTSLLKYKLYVYKIKFSSFVECEKYIAIHRIIN